MPVDHSFGTVTVFAIIPGATQPPSDRNGNGGKDLADNNSIARRHDHGGGITSAF
jgi:hypothetical protein